MKRIKRNLILLLIVVAAIGVFYIANKGEVFKVSTEQSSVSSLLQDNLVEISDFTSLKYEYSNVIISRTEKSLSLPVIPDINYGEAIKFIRYSGYLKAGFDFSKIQVIEGDPLIIKLPRSQILDNVVETEKTTVEDIKGNIFSDYPSQTILDEINAEKDKLEKDKVNQGFLEEADKAALKFLSSFLKSHGYDEFVIDFFTP